MQGASLPHLCEEYIYTVSGAAARTFHVKESAAAMAEPSLCGSLEEQHRLWKAHRPCSQEALGRRDIGSGNTEFTDLGPPDPNVW